MSEYHEVAVEFKDQAVLVESIKEIGCNPTVHAKGVQLSNNYSKSKPNVHIVIPRSQFGGMGDLGFEKTAKGFVMHADDYDYGTHGNKFNLKRLNLVYGENKLKKYANSTSKCSVLSRKKNKAGNQVEVMLKVRI